MRIAVVGAGAIGGFVAAMLARAGNDVAVVARGGHLRAIEARGLTVQSEAGNFNVAIPASADLRNFPPFEAVLLAVKAHQLQGVVDQVEPSLRAGACVVPMQNGIPFWYFPDRSLDAVDPGGIVRRRIPREHIVGCVVHASGDIPRPGIVHQSGGMHYILGDPDGGESPRAQHLAAVLREAGMQAPVVRTIKRDLWRKLLGNVSLNPVSALTRRTIGMMLRDAGVRSLIATLMRETMAVGAADGVDVDISIEDRIQFASRLDDVKTSMLQDVEAGRPLEVDPIVGAVVELAAQHRLDVPAVRIIYALTKALSA